ncbi:MAG: hypothetical protein LKH46_02530 [Pediococcus pentosaceus]|jgi:hypothetical protein|nr:hypothetical protein [Pediococcus pentosaceus]MCH4059238.1 hypothetical protein [Pediococcus pentosaceus]MCI1506532.1 hypothetical protein [Pediococcus pentosaceus]
MKLVRVNENIVLDIDDVQFVVWDDIYHKARISFKSNGNCINTEDEKVPDTIYSFLKSNNSKNGEQLNVGFWRLADESSKD